MKCKKCGSEVGKKDSFCEKCGTALLKGISQKKIIAAVLILGMVLLGYWAFLPHGDNSSVIQEPTSAAKPTIKAELPRSTSTVASGVTATVIQSPSTGMEFVLIPAGEFDMDSPSTDTLSSDSERPVHHVKLAKAFYMGKYEVTQKQWRDVMGTNPSRFTGDDLPVEDVTWNEVQGFINTLNYKEGSSKYRLPSEAEWEYAARAGTILRYSFGDDESKLGDYAWYYDNSNNKTHPVGQKKPNLWGLYDIHGNVREWVQDIYHSDYYGAPTNGSAWEGSGSSRVFRGGDWFYCHGDCRSALRTATGPGGHGSHIGFRLLRDL